MTTEAEFIARISERLGRSMAASPPLREKMDCGDAPNVSSPRYADNLTHFAAETTLVGARVEVFDTREALQDRLGTLLENEAGCIIGSWSLEALAEWGIENLAETGKWLTPASPSMRSSAGAFQIGITGADAAIAETGTLMLRSDRNRSRSVSLMPYTHIALLDQTKIAASMEEALLMIQEDAGIRSAIQFITGPSRSADIENVLSIGVHCPAALYIFIVRNRHLCDSDSGAHKPAKQAKIISCIGARWHV